MGDEVKPEVDGGKVTSPSTTIAWDASSRVALVRYSLGATLASTDAAFLVDALTGWVGTDGAPFGVLADGAGLRGTDAQYRSKVSRFFKAHRSHAFIALFNLGPVIHVVVELFRVGTGVPLKSCNDEGAARAWLRTNGIGA
jgi:hypothetical protein